MNGARLWMAAGLAWTAGLGFEVAGGRLVTRSGSAHARLDSWSWERRAEAAPTFSPLTKVVLFTPGKPDPLIARIEAELSAVGIAVLKMTAPSESQLDAVVTREIAAGAAAAIRIIPHSRKTEVWTGDTTARVSSRRSIKPETSDAALSLIALRTVEFLRASLLDVKRRSVATGPSGAAASTGNTGTSPAAPATATATAAAPATVPGKAVALESAPGGQSSGQGSSPRSPPPADRGQEGEKGPASVTPGPKVALPSAPEVAPIGTADPASSPSPRVRETPPESAVAVQPEPYTRRPPPAGEGKGPTETANRSANEAPHEGAARSGLFEIAAGPAVLASPGGISPLGALAMIGRAPIAGRFGGELMAVFPLTTSHKKTTDGSVETSIALFGGAASVRLTPTVIPWIVDLAVGASVTMLRSVGSATGAVGNTPNVGGAVSTQMVTGHVRLGAGYRVNGWLVLRADAIAGALASRLSVGTRQTDTTGAVIDPAKLDNFGVWGPLFGGGTLALQASW